jgi:hypothetical protein
VAPRDEVTPTRLQPAKVLSDMESITGSMLRDCGSVADRNRLTVDRR